MQRYQKVYKIIKYLLIGLFATLFCIIIIQNIKIGNLQTKKDNLTNQYQTNQQVLQEKNKEEQNISENFDEYSEEELRKNGYVKNGETLVE